MLVDWSAIAGWFNDKYTAAVLNWNLVTTAAIRFYNVGAIGNFDADECGVTGVVFPIPVEIAKDNAFGCLLIKQIGSFLVSFSRFLERVSCGTDRNQ